MGSSVGSSPEYREAAERFGRALAAKGLGVVYGGAKVGLMGAVADAALEGGSEVVGVIPKSLADKEIAHNGLTELVLVNNMHERKNMMMERGDMFAAMPGGLGTLEEILEVYSFAQLSFHSKPLGVLNTRGYFQPLIDMFTKVADEGFMKREYLSYLVVGNDPEDLVEKLLAYSPQRVDKFK